MKQIIVIMLMMLPLARTSVNCPSVGNADRINYLAQSDGSDFDKAMVEYVKLTVFEKTAFKLAIGYYEDSSYIVYVTRTGKKYHSYDCRYAKNSTPVTLNEAVKAKYEPCGICQK